MRLIDADKLHPDRMTNKGNVAISQSQIAKAPTVNAVSEEVYTEEYNLRKDAELKVYKLERAIDEIKAEIESLPTSVELTDGTIREFTFKNCKKGLLKMIDDKVKEYTE